MLLPLTDEIVDEKCEPSADPNDPGKERSELGVDTLLSLGELNSPKGPWLWLSMVGDLWLYFPFGVVARSSDEMSGKESVGDIKYDSMFCCENSVLYLLFGCAPSWWLPYALNACDAVGLEKCPSSSFEGCPLMAMYFSSSLTQGVS